MSWKTKSRDIRPGDTVLVTGAAGGVGRHVVRALLDAGCEVRAVDERPADYRTLGEVFDVDELEWISTDLVDTNLDELVRDCEAVIHAAAFVGLSESYEELAPFNVELVEDLYRAARDAGVKHFVHFSAGTIYRPGRGLRGEGDAIDPSTDYEQTKVHSEERLQAAADLETHWTILRPAHVYGPHCESMAAGLVTLPPILRNFTPLLPGFSGGTRSSWIHVEDVAAATMAVLGNPEAYERAFNVADDTPLGFGEALTAMTEAYGLSIGPFLPFPSPTLLMTFSPVVDREYTASTIRTVLRQLWKRIAARHELDTPLRPKVDRSVLFYVAEDTVLDNSALRALGWAPKFDSLTEGITETIQWYQEHGWVPRYDTQAQLRLKDERDGTGFAFSQIVNGTWTTTEGEERHVALELEVEFPRVGRADLSGRINGEASFEGLAEDAELEGTIELAIFGANKIRYEFGFQTARGACRCDVAASFSPLRPISSLQRVEGNLRNAHGENLGAVVLNLDLAERAVSLLTSFRLL